MNKYSIVAGLYVRDDEVSSFDGAAVYRSGLSFEDAVKLAAELMMPVSIVPDNS